MKKMHLICNAHLDPVWLWQWKEGAAEAISTFRIAADFCEKYDGFVFNHNEALLYEWVEEYEPSLFERIKRLVKEGKWRIMGGWYLQPDCTMLSGESFLSQIELGRKYFKEKFGVEPTTAVNFDPFGHTKGLVQILEKTGYNAYMFMRPHKYERNFTWKGFADSSVTAHCIYGGYNTLKGDAIHKLNKCLSECANEDTCLLTWGIGNHGGGPSKIDVEALNEAIASHDDVEILHSSPDDYFEEIDKGSLPVRDESLVHTMVGCYSSMANIKKRHRELENKVALAQKVATFANFSRGTEYPEKEIEDIRKTLAFCQFHDILPGSCIKPAEEDSLRAMSYALEKCDKIVAKAFFSLAKGQKKAAEGEIPIMIYNPHPYKVNDTFKVGFMLQNQNWNEDEVTLAEVFAEDGTKLLCQNEKPEATFNLDWIKSVAFNASLMPCSMNRFNVRLTTVKKSAEKREYTDKITLKGNNSELVISRKTGLIEKYTVNGRVMLQGGGAIEVYKDNEDPWGMTVNGFYEKEGEFSLLSDEEAGRFLGYDERTENVLISEDGPVRTKIDAFFAYDKSFATVEYIFDKPSGDINVKITLNSANTNRCIKYRLDTCVENGEFYGQTAFGAEKLSDNGSEATYHKWCGIKNKNGGLYVINNSVYAGSFKDKSMYITLLRTPVYSAHPINQRQIAPHDRYLSHIDMGERSFEMKITSSADYEKKALFFNEEPIAISYFPHGEEAENTPAVVIDNEAVLLSLIKKEGNETHLHLFNASEKAETAKISGAVLSPCELSFKPYELKLLKIENGAAENQLTEI